MLDQNITSTLGRELYEAERRGVTLDPLTERHPDIDMEDAYAVQAEYARLRTSLDGTERVGVKVGATSEAIQTYFGIDQPDFGVLFADMAVPPGEPLDLAKLIQARIEPELAFVLSRDLAGPGITTDDVLAATAVVIPALEVIDSRIHEWRIKLGDTISDNGSSARYVLGLPLEGSLPDLADVEVRFRRNDDDVISAHGRDVYGHPAAAVAWLANRLGSHGDTLHAGELVLSGSFTTALECSPGDRFVAEFAEIGTVSLNVTNTDHEGAADAHTR